MKAAETTTATAAAVTRSLAAALAPSAARWRVEVLDMVASTQDVAREKALAGAPEGTAVLALGQTYGRGRRGRAWRSDPSAGLYLSVLLRPSWPAADAGWLSLLATLALARGLEAQGLRDARIHQPNDLYVGGAKLAGVLIEPTLAAGRIEFAVVGVGLNLAQRREDWRGTELEGRATSCWMEGVRLGVAEAAAMWFREFERLYSGAPLTASERSDLLTEWTARGGAATVPGWR